MSRCSNLIEKFQLLEISNLIQSDTGLSRIIRVSVKNSSHVPRIKVQKSKASKIHVCDWFSVTIEDNPKVIGYDKLSTKEFNSIKKFIQINKKITYWLLRYGYKYICIN